MVKRAIGLKSSLLRPSAGQLDCSQGSNPKQKNQQTKQAYQKQQQNEALPREAFNHGRVEGGKKANHEGKSPPEMRKINGHPSKGQKKTGTEEKGKFLKKPLYRHWERGGTPNQFPQGNPRGDRAF